MVRNGGLVKGTKYDPNKKEMLRKKRERQGGVEKRGEEEVEQIVT